MPTMSEEFVAFREVSFRYPGVESEVISRTSLTLREGEFFVLLGPSGCGKTTMLKMLAGFEQALSGTVEVGGRTVSSPDRDRSVIFQGDDSLLDWLDVRRNIEFGLRIGGVPKAERARRVAEVMMLVQLSGQDDKYPRQLSGGMKQRVQIARALVCDAPILLMDEPFGALDAQTRSTLQDELSRIWESTRRTILFITHDIAEAISLADRVGVMSAGPSATISHIITIEAPRPRRRSDAEFARLYGEIEAFLHTSKH